MCCGQEASAWNYRVMIVSSPNATFSALSAVSAWYVRSTLTLCRKMER